MEIKVEVINVGVEQSFGENNFKKRVLICKDEGQYSQEYCIEFVQDKCNLLDDVMEGTWVTVHYNLRSRKWTNNDGQDQYFLSMSGWKIEQ